MPVAALVLLHRWPQPLTFQVGPRPAAVGAWIAVPDREQVPLEFSDGTVIVLDHGAMARVEGVESAGARVVLERGHARARVVHRSGSRWTIAVGPFTVLVTGTQFSVAWDPVTRVFMLALDEGSVTVSGPVVGEGRRVRPGETVSVSTLEGRLETHDVESPERTEPAPPAPSESAPPAAAEEPRLEVPQDDLPSKTRAAHWRELAMANRYAEAIHAAEQAGFGRVCKSADAADLRMLGDAARLAGKPELARRAFASIRTRFSRSEQAAVAAFLLGKLSFDQFGAYAEAADWFGRYLSEQPDGPLARESAGRLIEARRNGADPSGARAAARTYLTRYPDGPHAALARSILIE